VPLSIRPASRYDLPLLARLNRHLIEDERSRNPMTVPELENRLAGWLDGNWSISVATLEQTIVGYAVHQTRPDGYDPTHTNVYLRQFFIGRAFLSLLRTTQFPPSSTIILDVLATNPAAARFWFCLGFQPYATTLEMSAR
jgi:hypothetical protein